MPPYVVKLSVPSMTYSWKLSVPVSMDTHLTTIQLFQHMYHLYGAIKPEENGENDHDMKVPYDHNRSFENFVDQIYTKKK